MSIFHWPISENMKCNNVMMICQVWWIIISFKDEETPSESIVYIRNNNVGGLGETTNVDGMTQLKFCSYSLPCSYSIWIWDSTSLQLKYLEIVAVLKLHIVIPLSLFPKQQSGIATYTTCTSLVLGESGDGTLIWEDAHRLYADTVLLLYIRYLNNLWILVP